MATIPPRCTPGQQQLLELNERFIPAAILDDGDLLILEDAGPMGGPYEGTHISKYLCWVLPRDGKLHGISWHYQHHHDLSIPPWDLHPPEPGPDLEAPERRLITLGAARTYLADTYDIRVTARSIRNWCASGRIACRRFSTRQNAPWHTTTRALDAIAAEWVDDVHVRGAEDDTRAPDRVAEVNRIRELAVNIASNLGEGTAEELVEYALSDEGREAWGIDVELDAHDRALLVRFVADSLSPEVEDPDGIQ